MDDGGRNENRDTGVAVAIRLGGIGLRITVDFELLVYEIDDPVIGNAGAGVETGFARAVVSQRTIADLNNQHGHSGMIAIILAPANHNRDIGFRFRSTEVHRQLHACPETCSQNAVEPFLYTIYG